MDRTQVIPEGLPLLDILWMLLAAALVMFMQGGFCLLESGLARAKNSINVAIKNLVDFCLSAAIFWCFGFALMFGASSAGLIGLSYFYPGADAGPWLLAFFLFQMVFCGTATTIISGAVAERMRFSSYLLVAMLVSGLFYPVFGHWAWGGAIPGTEPGWLAARGFIDFAGSTVVHSVGGWIALAAVITIGPRLGRFSAATRAPTGHNLPMATLGVLILWFGWFGFNGGSTLTFDERTPLILVNTNLAAALGGIAGLLITWQHDRKPDVSLVMIGVVSGLVGVTASCHIIDPWAACLIGAVAGAIGVGGTYLLARLHVDDVIAAVPAHALAGAWGTIAVALLGDVSQFPVGPSRWSQLLVQLQGVGVCFLWAFGGGLLVLQALHRAVGLRVSPEEERQGLNVAEHGASTELIDLLDDMREHRRAADFSRSVQVEPHTEVGQIAAEYNRVLERVSKEISAHQAASQAVRQAEEKYRGIFEHAVGGVFQTTPEGRYVVANPALARLYAYDSPEHLIAAFDDIGRQLYVDTSRRDEFKRLLAENDTVTGFESAVYRRDGRIIYIRENARTIRDAAGQVLYYEGTVEDITEQRLSERLQREKEAAVAASRAKSDFLATMSHEIRTPLNGVIGMLELLGQSALDERQSRHVRIARASANSLLALINDILDLAKVESGRLELEHTPFDLPELLEDVAESFIHRAEAKGLELTCHVVAGVPRRVCGDPERLRQVVTNLIGNALKFTERGEVSLRAELLETRDGQAHVKVSIRDTGIGIPPDRQEMLFQPFTQVDVSTTRKYGGTGLGLAICRQLIDLMGGQIGVDSRPGHGSTFWFCAPLESVAESQGALSDLPLSLKGLRVLAVDDNDTNLEILSEQLGCWGFEVETAASAEAAWRMLQQARQASRPFHLAILDQRMPDTDGCGLARRIRGEPTLAGLPLLMLTSIDAAWTSEELAIAGLAGFINKPVRQSRLLDAIIDAVSGGSLRPGARRSAHDPEAQSAPTPAHCVRPEEIRILVADDNEINQLVATEMLTAAGYQSRTAANGLQVLQALREEAFDLVLMDCEMPEMDGFSATREIRRREASRREAGEPDLPALPIVALTANAIKGDRERCLGVGMTDYVPKPIDREKLLSTIARLLAAAPRRASAPAAPANTPAVPSSSPAPTAAAAAAAADAASGGEPPIDLEELFERCSHNTDLQRRVLAKFAAATPARLAQLRAAVASGDTAAAVQSAHALHGAAGNLAAHEVQHLAAALESHYRGRSNDAAPPTLDELAARVDACLAFIDEVLNGPASDAAARGVRGAELSSTP